jgi:hypothetical protein
MHLKIEETLLIMQKNRLMQAKAERDAVSERINARRDGRVLSSANVSRNMSAQHYERSEDTNRMVGRYYQYLDELNRQIREIELETAKLIELEGSLDEADKMKAKQITESVANMKKALGNEEAFEVNRIIDIHKRMKEVLDDINPTFAKWDSRRVKNIVQEEMPLLLNNIMDVDNIALDNQLPSQDIFDGDEPVIDHSDENKTRSILGNYPEATQFDDGPFTVLQGDKSVEVNLELYQAEALLYAMESRGSNKRVIRNLSKTADELNDICGKRIFKPFGDNGKGCYEIDYFDLKRLVRSLKK